MKASYEPGQASPIIIVIGPPTISGWHLNSGPLGYKVSVLQTGLTSQIISLVLSIYLLWSLMCPPPPANLCHIWEEGGLNCDTPCSICTGICHVASYAWQCDATLQCNGFLLNVSSFHVWTTRPNYPSMCSTQKCFGTAQPWISVWEM